MTILSDSRVSEQPDTKCVADSMFWVENSRTTIFLKCKPFGRSNNLLIADWIPPITTNSRDPVNRGEVRGLVHLSVGWGVGELKERSSRRGREQMRTKMSESKEQQEEKRSDLMTVEILCSGWR